MSDSVSRPRTWVQEYLDPGERLAEVLFGLIMVLTITLTAGLTVGQEPGAAREMLMAAIGCNVAWGIIDGGMYIMGALLERGRLARQIEAIRHAPDEPTAMRLVSEGLDETLIGLAPSNQRTTLTRDLLELARRATPRRVRITYDDWMGALASGWLVIAATIPAAVPFMLMRDAHRALRVSNGLLLGLLFLVGFSWGRYANVNRWVAGTVFLTLGVILVGVAIALGG
jgi:hypothetical protein